MEMLSGKCRKHPNSNKQPGICSVCLRDRLLQLADAYNHSATFQSISLTADDRCLSFSLTSSTSSSPPIYFLDNRTKKHVRNASSDALRSYVIGGGGELKKSRSTNVVDGSGTKRGIFWKKLLKIKGSGGAAGKEVAALGKSRTLKERFDDS